MENVAICFACKHLNQNIDLKLAKDDFNFAGCTAFPRGIPKEIWEDGFDHRKPLGLEDTLFTIDDEDGFIGLSLKTLKNYEIIMGISA